MNRYGQAISWSTPNAPHVFTGICTNYRYNPTVQSQLDEDESGDNRAIIQHSKKAELSFEAKITEDSTDFLDLSAGAMITVTGTPAGGVILARRAIERWVLQQPKTASVEAIHFPVMSDSGAVAAGVDLDAFTPDQSALGIVTPGGSLIYGTHGMTHGSGVLHELEIAQELTITEDDPSPAGTLLGAAAHGYLRRIRMMLLATGTRPAVEATLALTGAPDHAADYKIESAPEVWSSKRGKMYEVTAIWIPPFTA